jgi:ketosteroid isomerase-like protein
MGWLLAVGITVALGTSGLLLPAQEKQAQQPSVVPATDEQKVDLTVSEMLAGWQIGDMELLRKAYADDVMVVSGLFEPPVVGWPNYANAYRQQRARMEQVRMERRNSYITLRGNVAWVAYQWEFTAIADGRAAAAQGHTTLILEKRGGRWLIVHNHTSIVGPMQTAETAPAKPSE